MTTTNDRNRNLLRAAGRAAAAGIAAMAVMAVMVMTAPAAVPSAGTIRVGVLRFGTVNWQLNVLTHHKLDEKYGFSLETLPLSSKNAAVVALQGGGADIVVTDWFWVARQRGRGLGYSFAPYSRAAGGLVTRADGDIGQLSGLRGRKVGVAGGKVDKNWLLLRAYALRTLGYDLEEVCDVVYGASPLLTALLENDELDAVLVFWQDQARLAAGGAETVIKIRDVMKKLDIRSDVPVNGWVFSSDWAGRHPALLEAFLAASREAARIMLDSDEEWERLATLMRPEQRAVLPALRKGYRDGVIRRFGDAEKNAARRLYDLLSKLGGRDLVGDVPELAAGVFWPGATTSGDARP